MSESNVVVDEVVADEVVDGAAVEVDGDDERVSMEDFITAWENAVKSGGGGAEVSKVTGLKKESIQARASKYRSEYGIPLSNMKKGGGAKLDKAAAIALLARLRGQDVQAVEAQSAQLAVDKATRNAERDAAKAEKAAS